MKLNKSSLMAMALTAILAVPFAANAHKPMFDDPDSTGFDHATKVPDPAISWAVYADLNSCADVDFYSFEVKKPMTLYAGLIVPKRDDYAAFYPVYAIVGPGLPAPAPGTKLPFQPPKGYGVVVMNAAPSNPRPEFYEPFSKTSYYKGIPDFRRDVTQTGTYYMVVWDPAGEWGSYTATVGMAEKWGWRDLGPTIKAVKKIKNGDWIIKPGKPDTTKGCKATDT
jgi:hypothetical protein